MNVKKVLVVEDDTAIKTLLKYNLEQAGYQATTSSDGQVGYELALNNEYDFILLDVMLPNLDGLEITKRLRQEKVMTPILIITARDQELDKIIGLELGADDYLTKPFEIDELVVRVRALLKRANSIPKTSAVRDLLTYKEITLLPETYSVQINDKVQKLTPIEFDIFNLLFQNHGNMVPASKLLKDVWGYEPDDSVETIRVHIRHLRSKIDKISGDKKYIETIYGGGYKLNI